MDELSEQHDGLPSPSEPGLGTIEILVGQEHVLSDLADQRPPAEAPDAVAGHRTQDLPQGGDDDHQGELQWFALARNLPTGQDAPVDQRDLGPDREAHGRDEAQGENRSVARLT